LQVVAAQLKQRGKYISESADHLYACLK